MSSKILLIATLLTISFLSFAQRLEDVKTSKDYYYAEGFGETETEAKKVALDELTQSIYVSVSSQFSQRDMLELTNGVATSQASISNIVNTYSNATLTDVHSEILQSNPNFRVACWISKLSVQKEFDSRMNKIRDLIEMAIRAEQKIKLDFALKSYYAALMLTYSLQRPNEMLYTTEDGIEHVVLSWLPQQIESIFSEITIDVTERIDDEVELSIRYKGQKVSSVDILYSDGMNSKVGPIGVRDGVTVIEMFPGYQPQYYQIDIEYQYLRQSHIDRDLQSVMDVLPPLKIRGATMKIRNNEKLSSPIKDGEMHQTSSPIPNDYCEISNGSSSSKNDSIYVQKINKIIESLPNGDLDEVKPLFTTNGFDIYKRLLRRGRAKVVGNSSILTLYSSGDEVIVRGLQMLFSFSNGSRKSFTENVAFTFNSERKIDNISFGLDVTAEKDILEKDVWSEDVRVALVKFLENYQTAYALKRYEYIESIFDDDAVIITGTIVRKAGKYGEYTMQLSDQIRYNKMDKNTYIEKLKRSFESKDYISIRFGNNDVRKLGKGGDLYAIQLYQEYYSNNYGDKGFLFLMIDLNDTKNPIIKVRTWQVEKDPDFGIIGPDYFK